MITRNRFPQIIAELTPKLGAAVQAGAEIIERGAKERAPVDEGNLRAAIHTDRDGPLAVRVVAGNADVFYGHLVEHGTVRTAPRPFLVPAAEAARGEVLALVRTALRGL